MGWKKQLVEQLPWKKLTRHDITNLCFDVIALGYTAFVVRHVGSDLILSITLVAVIVLCLVCFGWASKL
jgi:hypothetical protein